MILLTVVAFYNVFTLLVSKLIYIFFKNAFIFEAKLFS